MDENLKPLLQAFLGQMESAMKVSDVLADHASSEEITVDHLITGLVYRLMVPMTNDEITLSLASAGQLIDSLNDSCSDTDDEEEEEELVVEHDFGSRKVIPVSCNCDICSQSRICLRNFSTYDCSDPLADKFKSAIDATCHKHKIYI